MRNPNNQKKFILSNNSLHLIFYLFGALLGIEAILLLSIILILLNCPYNWQKDLFNAIKILLILFILKFILSLIPDMLEGLATMTKVDMLAIASLTTRQSCTGLSTALSYIFCIGMIIIGLIPPNDER